MLAFAAPQYAWALVIPAAVVALYLLRRKYVPRQVPSAFLWRKSLQDHAANRPLQRLRKNLLLPVQLLAALALALGLMQPCISGETAGRTILIFDVSGSMQTVTAGRTRLDEAKAQAEELLRGLPAGEEITVLVAGEETRQLTLGTRDREEVRRAIASLRCGKGGADLARALTLAEAVRREEGEDGTGARIVVYSDTYIPKSAVTAVNVGAGEENRAVYALTAEEGKAYARIANYGEACVLTVTCRADGKLAEAKELEIPAGETAGVSFALPPDASLAEVSIRESDALPADNRAEAPVMRSVRRTVALDADSLFLESALKTRPDLTVVRTAGENPEGTPADLYILGGNPVIFTLHPGETVFTWGGEQEAKASLAAAEDIPLTSGLTLKNVAIRAFRPVSGGKALLRCGEETAAAYTDTEVIIGFDLHDTNLPLKYDFPVLVQNILDMLIPSRAADVPETEPLMAMAESDVRAVAPDAEGPGSSGRPLNSRDLTVWFLAAFLILLLVEFALARELYIRRVGKEGGAKHAR